MVRKEMNNMGIISIFIHFPVVMMVRIYDKDNVATDENKVYFVFDDAESYGNIENIDILILISFKVVNNRKVVHVYFRVSNVREKRFFVMVPMRYTLKMD